MPTDAPDPRVVRSLAVRAEDVALADEYNLTGRATAVLRGTPPFHGRMRARLHVGHRDEPARAGRNPSEAREPVEGSPVYVPPAAFLDESAVPDYLHADETAAALRTDPDADYAVDSRSPRRPVHTG